MHASLVRVSAHAAACTHDCISLYRSPRCSVFNILDIRQTNYFNICLFGVRPSTVIGRFVSVHLEVQISHSSLGVEHSLSKRKVVGSNPACG